MYLLDSNVLIEAKNRYYAFDLAPGFWVWLDHAHRRHLVASVVAFAGHDPFVMLRATGGVLDLRA